MEDALNSNAWLQPNTFMDVIAPRTKKAPARSKPHRSETLMRSAVKKPVYEARVAAEPAHNVQSSDISSHRQDLPDSASLTDRSPLISRFSPGDYQQLEVETVSHPMQESELGADLTPATFDEMDAQPLAIAMEQPSFNIFKNGMNAFEASQPVETLGSKWNVLKRLSGWSVLAIVLVGVVGGGILINRNLSRVELYMASSRAGFAATLPSAIPSGYDLSSISTGSGAIEASFKSNTDNRNYTISEKKSAVSSTGLMDDYVQNEAGLNFQTVKTDNNTIYIYNGHNATWVNNGIWYVVQDNNSLSDHQIINIADSM